MANAGGPRIALIHGLGESLAPCHRALAEHWPEAQAYDLLDTSLSADRSAYGKLDETFYTRIRELFDYAVATKSPDGGPAGVLFTCSAFGPAIEAVQKDAPLPVLKPTESAFEEALAQGSTIGLITTFGPSLPALTAELLEMAESKGATITVPGACAEGAMEALHAGDGAEHDRLIVEAAKSLGEVDCIVIGQFSAARAAPAVREATGLPVITTPDAAVAGLKRLVGAARS